MKKGRIVWIAAIAAVLLAAGYLTIATCGKTDAAVAPPPAEVEVATVQQQDLPIEREWVGTLDGMVNVAIKAQVSGYLLRQNYTEGSFVRTGQLLFEIDPRPFQTAVEASFDKGGVAGLVPQKRGPRGPHKLRGQALAFVQQQLVAGEPVRARELAKLIRQKFDLNIHPRTIERAVAGKKTSR